MILTTTHIFAAFVIQSKAWYPKPHGCPTKFPIVQSRRLVIICFTSSNSECLAILMEVPSSGILWHGVVGTFHAKSPTPKAQTP